MVFGRPISDVQNSNPSLALHCCTALSRDPSPFDSRCSGPAQLRLTLLKAGSASAQSALAYLCCTMNNLTTMPECVNGIPVRGFTLSQDLCLRTAGGTKEIPKWRCVPAVQVLLQASLRCDKLSPAPLTVFRVLFRVDIGRASPNTEIDGRIT
jgi:hypothetical protein